MYFLGRDARTSCRSRGSRSRSACSSTARSSRSRTPTSASSSGSPAAAQGDFHAVRLARAEGGRPVGLLLAARDRGRLPADLRARGPGGAARSSRSRTRRRLTMAIARAARDHARSRGAHALHARRLRAMPPRPLAWLFNQVAVGSAWSTRVARCDRQRLRAPSGASGASGHSAESGSTKQTSTWHCRLPPDLRSRGPGPALQAARVHETRRWGSRRSSRSHRSPRCIFCIDF